MARELVADLKQMLSQQPGLDVLDIAQRLRGYGWAISASEVKRALQANLTDFRYGSPAQPGWFLRGAALASAPAARPPSAPPTAPSLPVGDRSTRRLTSSGIGKTKPAVLRVLVRHYIREHRPRVQEELRWYAEQPSLAGTIEQAALCQDNRGKRNPHQRRITRAALELGRARLLTAAAQIVACRSFDELFELIEAVTGPISGLGELYVYDVAVGIGARLGLAPDKVYLHAGTRAGAYWLGLDYKARALDMAALPEELRELSAREVEDVLCIYKARLASTLAEEV